MRNDELERVLRNALHHEADRIIPTDRRLQILEEASSRRGSWWQRIAWLPGRRLVAPVLSTALVLGVASVGVHHFMLGADTPPATPAHTPSLRALPPPPDDNASAPVVVEGRATVPMYYVGVDYIAHEEDFFIEDDVEFLQSTTPEWRLYREWSSVSASQDDPAELVTASLRQRLQRRNLHGSYAEDPLALGISSVSVTAQGIGVKYQTQDAVAGTPAPKAEVTQSFFRSLTWTAQAALGRGNVPVTFTDAGTAVSKPLTLTRSVDRDLASVMLSSSASSIPSGQRARIEGWGCTELGHLTWKITPEVPGTVTSGTFITAICRTRTKWKYTLPQLPPGTYTVSYSYGHGSPGSLTPLQRTFTVTPDAST